MNQNSLGGKPTAQPSKTLETFENPNAKRDIHIHMQIPEFTCLCPKTGQPDFATLYLDYIPDKTCVELKSLKLYIWSFRDEGCFHESRQVGGKGSNASVCLSACPPAEYWPPLAWRRRATCSW